MKHDDEPIKSKTRKKMERHWKYLLFLLISQCIVPARCVHFDSLFKKLSSTAPPLNNNIRRKEKYIYRS